MVLDSQKLIKAITGSPTFKNLRAQDLVGKLTDAEGADVQFDGDLLAGFSIGQVQSILVCGSLIGSESEPCEIQATGDVVVLGDVSHAKIHAQRICIEGAVSQCQLHAQTCINITSDLKATQCHIGGQEKVKHPLEVLQDERLLIKKELEDLRKRLNLAEKSLDKKFKALRLSIHLSIGRIIQQQNNRVVIDLSPIYPGTAGQSRKVVDQMVLNFFAKALVGKMVQANRTYLSGGKHRVNNFRNVIADLKELVLEVLNFDNYDEQFKVLDTKVRDGIQDLRNGSLAVSVGGKLTPDVHLNFVAPDISSSSAGQTDFKARRVAQLDYVVEENGQTGLHKTDLDEFRHAPEMIEGLGHVTFALHHNEIKVKAEA